MKTLQALSPRRTSSTKTGEKSEGQKMRLRRWPERSKDQLTIIVGHPSRAGGRLNMRRLDSVPEVGRGESLAVEPLALAGGGSELEGLADNGSGRRSLDIAVATDPEDDRAEEEDEGRQEVCEADRRSALDVVV